MRICNVAKCGRKISDGVKLYSLPENSVRRQLWLDKIKILNVEKLIVIPKSTKSGYAQSISMEV
jgi:hypothetical protein